MKTFSLSILLASSLGMVASPSLANWGHSIQGEYIPVQFKYQPAELSTEMSRDALLKRLKSTAYTACAGMESRAYFSSQNCREDIEQQFVKAISNSMLTAQYGGETIRVAQNVAQ